MSDQEAHMLAMMDKLDQAYEPGTEVEVKTDDLAALEMSEAHKKAFALLRMAVLTIDDLVDQNADNIDGSARAEVMLEVIKRDLSAVIDKIHTNMAEHAPSYQFSVPGVGTYTKCKAGAKTIWDTEAVLDLLIERSYDIEERGKALDKETGEIPFPMATLKGLLMEFARLEWRSTPFKNRGIPLDDLREQEGGRPSVRRLNPSPK